MVLWIWGFLDLENNDQEPLLQLLEIAECDLMKKLQKPVDVKHLFICFYNFTF